MDKKILDYIYPNAGYVYPSDVHQRFFNGPGFYRVKMDEFLLQTTFVAVAAAVIVNLFPRKPIRK